MNILHIAQDRRGALVAARVVHGIAQNVALTWAIPSASIMRFVFFPVAIGYFVTFFLPAIARRGPFFVRALV